MAMAGSGCTHDRGPLWDIHRPSAVGPERRYQWPVRRFFHPPGPRSHRQHLLHFGQEAWIAAFQVALDWTQGLRIEEALYRSFSRPSRGRIAGFDRVSAHMPVIVIVTAYDKYALETFEAGAPRPNFWASS